VETRRVRQEVARLRSDVAALSVERAGLVEEARRLREDPAAIEAVARRELGLLRPGELLVFVRGSSDAWGSTAENAENTGGDRPRRTLRTPEGLTAENAENTEGIDRRER